MNCHWQIAESRQKSLDKQKNYCLLTAVVDVDKMFLIKSSMHRSDTNTKALVDVVGLECLKGFLIFTHCVEINRIE